jgi:hypothetical protein
VIISTFLINHFDITSYYSLQPIIEKYFIKYLIIISSVSILVCYLVFYPVTRFDPIYAD